MIEDQSKYAKSDSSEIFIIKERKWIQGPNILQKIGRPTCVPLPITMNYHCIVIGSVDWNCDNNCCGNCIRKCHRNYEHVYGLNKSLTAWLFLGKYRRNDRFCYVALPIS